jgi:hypothetical protein
LKRVGETEGSDEGAADRNRPDNSQLPMPNSQGTLSRSTGTPLAVGRWELGIDIALPRHLDSPVAHYFATGTNRATIPGVDADMGCPGSCSVT